MRQSLFFIKTRKEAPKEEGAKNAQLLIRGGFVEKMSAGVYAYLPLGFRTLSRIVKIIREEMNAIGAEEILMPSLVAREYWQKTGRWDVDVIYKTGDEAYGLGWTHEEVISSIATHSINSYQDLPRAAYQIQTKFRAELRARSGILRGREFLMKDLYSFHIDEADLARYYEVVIGAYWNIIRRLGLGESTRLVEASGGAFTEEFTHEFQTFSEAGEDAVVYCTECDFARNKEIGSELMGMPCPKCGKKLIENKAIEVANVFKLGTRYSVPYGLLYTSQDGSRKPVVMGSYGIGPSRMLGTIAELFSDEHGLCWPDAVAPFRVHLLALGKADGTSVYRELVAHGIEVLFDDRDLTPGQKLSDADLLGIPWRAVISEKTGSKVEIKRRDGNEPSLYALSEFLALLHETKL